MSKTKQPRCHRIPDGYTLSGTIPGKEGLYPELHVTCRPFALSERETWMRYFRESRAEKPKRDAEFYVYQMSKLVASRIVEWDAVDEDGKLLTIDVNAVKALHPGLYDDLTNVVLGERALIQTDEQGEHDPEYEAYLRETGMSQAEADAKNSSTEAV